MGFSTPATGGSWLLSHASLRYAKKYKVGPLIKDRDIKGESIEDLCESLLIASYPHTKKPRQQTLFFPTNSINIF